MEIKKIILALGAAAFVWQESAYAKVKIHTKYNSIAYQQKEKEKQQNRSLQIDFNHNTNGSQNEERFIQKIDRLQDRIDELKDTIKELKNEVAEKNRAIEILREKNNAPTENLLNKNNQY